MSDRVQLGSLVKLSTESAKDPAAVGLTRSVGLDHIDSDDLRLRRWSDIGNGADFTRVFRPGDVLFGKRRSYQRKVALADFDGVCSGDILVVRSADPRLDGLYLAYLLASPMFIGHAISSSAGSLSPRIRPRDLERFELNLPALDEQHRVVEVMRAVDREIEAAEQVQEASVRALRSYWAEVAGPKRLLGQVAKIWGGGTPDTKNPGFWDGSTPWLAPAELRDRDGEEIYNTERTITEAGLRAIGGRLAPSGAVLITSRATVGTVVTAGRPIAVNQGIAVLEPGPDIDGRYLKNWCRFNTHEFLRLAGGSTFLEVSKTSIASIALPVPSAEDQETIAALSSRLEDCARDGQASAHASYALRTSLLQELIG